MPNLPDDIIFDILTRLPVVSLCRFKCVSKPWRSLISQPHFIRTHLNRNIDNKHERLVLCSDWNLFSVDLESSQFGDESVAVPLIFPAKQNPNDWDEICCSCDGLLLVCFSKVFQYIHYSLVNPATREFKILPQSPSPFDPWKSFNDYGLGFDSSNDDYKVVSISYPWGTKDNEVSIYSSRTNSWKQIGKSPYDHHPNFGNKSGFFVSGALHWIASTSTSVFIYAIDLADEKFRIVPSPSSVGHNKITALGGCLCVSSKRRNDSHTDVWVMKDYGVNDSWTKFRVTHHFFFHYWRPLSSSRTDRVLFNNFHENINKLVCFDPLEEKSKELVIRGHATNFEAETYVESLVFCA